jgi:3-hydroxybutyryl-CoA dehydratase
MSQPHDPIHIGDILPACEVHITQEMIDVYAAISGDFNPIHVDAQAAAASAFGGTIAHGCIPMEPVFQAIMRWRNAHALPRDTAIRLRYRAPSRPGDVIRSEASVRGDRQLDGRRLIEIGFVCLNQRGERVIDGECDLIL